MRINKTVKRILIALVLTVSLLAIVYSLPEGKNKFKSRHFTFIFSNSTDTKKIKALADALEENYSRISNDLATTPANNIEVNIYAARWRYIKATGNWGASGSIEGIAKLHFVEQAWSESYSQKVAIHEFTHAVVLKLLLDREPQPLDAENFDRKFTTFPVWLWEATSCYEAGQFEDPKNIPFFTNGTSPSLKELNDRSKGGKIYKAGYTIIEFILQKYGREKFIELLANYGNLSKVLNLSEKEFAEAWYNFVKAKYL